MKSLENMVREDLERYMRPYMGVSGLTLEKAINKVKSDRRGNWDKEIDAAAQTIRKQQE